MKFITEQEFMELIDHLKVEFDKLGERFDKIDKRFDVVDQKFAVIERNFNKVFQELNYHGSRLKYIEDNMVHKSQFNSLVSILERKEVITSFEKDHVLFKNIDILE